MKTKFSIIWILALCLSACIKEPPIDVDPDDGYEELVKTIESDPLHEQFPPTVEAISFEVLAEVTPREENVRLVAQIPREELEAQYLALEVGLRKIVLRDDGKGADQVADDRNFSILLQEDVPTLQKILLERKELGLAGLLNRFETRTKKPLDREAIRNLDLEEIGGGRVVQLPIDILTAAQTGAIAQDKSLMITDVGVVEDPIRTFNPCTGIGNPNGVWTFGELMRQLASSGSPASDTDASLFVMDWLNSWTTIATVNSDVIAARTTIQNLIITPWLNASLAAGAPPGELKMELAPFKLMAIVNRLDLRGNSAYGVSNAGEGRLVFCALDNQCNALRFTVIFEYGINIKNCQDLKAFGQEWADLDNHPLGSSAYNQALEQITLQFTQSGTNPAKPNQSSLNQLRTNENALAPIWQLREFQLNNSGLLELVTTKMEPAQQFQPPLASNVDVKTLVDFINAREVLVENNKYTVPELVPQTTGSLTLVPFLAGKSMDPNPGFHWDGNGANVIVSDLARRNFSLNTCSGCHSGETQTFFTHITPNSFGSNPFGNPAGLSGFLTGIVVPDPAGRTPTWSYADLDFRETKLDELLNQSCSPISIVFGTMEALTFEVNAMVH